MNQTRMTASYHYFTTAIDYVNGEPHLGHAYEKIITDVMARASLSLGHPVYFLTGLDEHGQKVQQAAQSKGLDPQTYCDGLAQTWKQLTIHLKLSNNGFVRTTDPAHQIVVQAILNQLHQNGHFYRSPYQGYYSTKEETFLTDKDRRPDGSFDPAFGEVVELIEENYYFKLKEHQQWLLDYIEAHPEFIQPEERRNEVLGFLKSTQLEDLCITRPKSRLSWGIPLPFDPEYVTYVWFDALVNYISHPALLGDPTIVQALHLEDNSNFKPYLPKGPGLPLWPATAHVIGKDILKFHAVYWPIMLKAMNLPLPHQILAHGWWQRDNQKMSKSTGNIVNPVQVIQDWGLDAFRFYVVRELDIGPDGNWTDEGFVSRYNAELANGLGNLIQRSLSMLKRYREGRVPPLALDLAPDATQAIQQVKTLLAQKKLQASLIAIWKLIDRANKYVEETAPFKLAKDPAQADRLDQILYNLVETTRILSVLLTPFLPETCDKITHQLNLPTPISPLHSLEWGGIQAGHIIAGPQPLFPKKDTAP